jgi:uncharacterized protein (TIGR02301 family)
MMRIPALAILFAFALAIPARAQTYEAYQQRNADLIALSMVYGEIHYIRRTCLPRYEADTWRERMKQLLELEEPEQKAREEMVASFNAGYRRAQDRFSTCDRNARDYAAARARMGDEIVERLMAPLYEALEDEEDLPQIVRGIDVPGVN